MIHERPAHVVETGVARGISSATILTAMRQNGIGHLYSIDLPPLRSSGANEIGAAVAPELRDRWTYVRGSARRRLPELVRGIGSVDLFVHDSLHTYGNMRFEFQTVWPALSSHGIVMADDIESNPAFDEVSAGSSGHRLIVAQPTKSGSLFGIYLRSAGAAAVPPS
jgi:predicted O-methyltransferase YrrM